VGLISLSVMAGHGDGEIGAASIGAPRRPGTGSARRVGIAGFSPFSESARWNKNGGGFGAAARAAPASDRRHVEVYMVAAVVLRKENTPESLAASSRSEVLARYRHLREISKRHHSKMLDFLSRDAVFQHARRLGLAHGKTLVLDDMDELTFAFDLAIHTAPMGRSRAIDRYAGSARLAPRSDEALVLEAMRRARFSVVRVERRHEAAGLIVKDLFRRIELWLVDEGLESSLPDRWVLATRLYTPDGFSMTAGVAVPLDLELMVDALDEVPQLRRKSHAEAVDDRRFAEAIYRVALAGGLMERIAFRDPDRQAG